MAFRVGQKVVFVDPDSGDGAWHDADELTVGAVYTIGNMFADEEGDLILELSEKKRGDSCFECWGHRGYWAARFRPAVERKTDISIFTAMLTGTKQPHVVALGES